jgi:hypothetical protein
MSQIRELFKHTAATVGYATGSTVLVYQTYDYLRNHSKLRTLMNENEELRVKLNTTQRALEAAESRESRKRWW